MNPEQVLRDALHSRLDVLDPPVFPEPLLQRTKRRRFSLLALASGGVVVTLLLGTLAWQALTSSPATDGETLRPIATAPASASPSPSLGWRCLTGPWATHCPEAQWARRVAERAGYRVVGDTGSALIIDNGENSFYYKAYEPEGRRSRGKSFEEAYRPVFEVEGTIVYSDGAQLTWDVHGMWAWLESGPEKGPKITDEDVVAPIVRASIELPYP